MGYRTTEMTIADLEDELKVQDAEIKKLKAELKNTKFIIESMVKSLSGVEKYYKTLDLKFNNGEPEWYVLRDILTAIQWLNKQDRWEGQK